MSKISKQVDQQQQSDSDLSLQLSDASSLTSDTDLSDTQQQQQVKKKASTKKKKKKTVKKTTKKSAKNKKNVKDNTQYCTCRRGYDGKEFMIECDGCQEWFHGACVGLKPNSVTDHYFCKSCLKAKKKPAMSAGKTLIPPPAKKKSIIILPISKPEPPPPTASTIPVISKLSIQDDEDEDEDLDDICPVCDGDCTCGTGATITNTVQAIIPPTIPNPSKTEVPKLVIKKTIPAAKSKKSKQPKKSIAVRDSLSDDSSSNESGVSDSGSGNSDSNDEDDAVVERNGMEVKKKPMPKKKTAATPTSAIRRGKSTTLLANIVRQKAPHYAYKGKGKGGKKTSLISSTKLFSEEENSEEEVVVDDLDDLLETMSPLSEHSSNESDNSLLESEEFFTDDDEIEDDIDVDSSLINSPYPESRTSYSSVHIDSGDDEDIENTETQAIIADMTLNSDEDIDDGESDLDEGMFVEDEDDDDEMEGNGFSISYYSGNNNWSSDDEDEEEEEFDYTTALPSEDDINNADIDDSDEDHPPNSLLPLLDSEGNLYDNIATAFMHALTPATDMQQNGDAATGANTPSLDEEYQLSAFELAHALSTLSRETSRQHQQEYMRRPSLPSSAVSAAQRNRGSQDFNSSEALRALTALVSDDLALSLEPIHESEDISDNQEIDTKKTHASSPPSSMQSNLTISTDLATSTSPPSAVTTPTTAILPNQLALSLSTDLKLQEQILDILKGSNSAVNSSTHKLSISSTSNNSTNTATPSSSSLQSLSKKLPLNASSLHTSNSSRQILPKPSGSGVGSSSSAFSFFPTSLTTAALEQQIQDAINESIENNKRRGLSGFFSENNNSIKKRRVSRSNSLDTGSTLQPMETTSFSTPASPAAIVDELEDMNIQIDEDEGRKGREEDDDATAVSMDDLVDTSQLYTRSLSRSPSPEVEDNPYSRDLSRWQRIPIGAFRLMRSKNKLWLER